MRTAYMQVSMPGTPVIVITDPSKEILKSELPEDLLLKPVPGDYGSGNLMLQRLESYIVHPGLLDSL